MKIKRMVSLLLAIATVTATVGCGEKKEQKVSNLPYAINEMKVENIDDLPDWTGSELDLTVWYGYGPNNVAIGKLKTDDKFQGEMKRVSGISISEENSFDNAGDSGDAKIAKMVSTKAWPHIGVGVEASILQTLCEADKLYDITDLIPKYMPNYMAYVNSNDFVREQYEAKTTYDGRKYTFCGLSNVLFKYTDPEYTPEKYSAIKPIAGSRSTFWIRDDILKAIHPEAHTVKELQEIYMRDGKFTKEVMDDFTVKSLDEFRKLLEDIKALNITENGRQVWPFYTHNGMDNWDLLTMMTSLAGGGPGGDTVNYFLYYDVEQQKLVNTVKQQWFKDFVKFFNGLYIDGLAPQEALIDNKANFDQKKNNGEYAILYGTVPPPTEEALKAAGKDYQYRKVFIDIPMDYSRFIDVNTESIFNSYSLCFFKDKMNETELEQVLRFLDFFYTDAGMKFANWGPKSAGLYVENEDGTLKYTDEKFEAARVYSGDDKVLYDYGFSSFPPIFNFISPEGINKYQPKLMYSRFESERKASDYVTMWNYGYVEPIAEYPHASFSWDVWNFPQYVEGVKSFWNSRQVIEEAIKTVFTAKDDAQFEEYYNKLIEIEERQGYDDACFEEINKVFAEKNGEKLIEELNTWKP